MDAARVRADGDDSLVKATLAQTYGGIRLPARQRTMLLAQQQKTRKAVDAEVRAPSGATHAQAVHE